MEFLPIYLSAALLIFGLMSALWLLSLILKDSSIVDIFWGFGFVIAYWFYFSRISTGFVPRQLLLGVLVTLWGLRLAFYLLRRNWGKGEDYRYRTWREQSRRQWWWQSFFKVFLLQGVLLWLISAPLLAAQINPDVDRLTILDFIAVFLWVLGFILEAGGDWQLARFKSDPANQGQVYTGGFWRYTRHPNYFGDAVQWWAFYLFALAAGGWWTIFSPLLMTLLLRRFSGVTLLERSLIENKPGYKDYVETTNAFFPWFPRTP